MGTLDRVFLAVVAIGCLGVSAIAEAAPVEYDFTGGYVTLLVTSSSAAFGTSTVVEPTNIALSGSEVTFNATTNQLTNFQFTTTGSTTIDLSGSLAVAGVPVSLVGDTVTLANLSATPGAGYTSSAMSFTGGVYSFMAGPVNAQGQYGVSAGSMWNVASGTPFNVTPSSNLDGQLQISNNQFALNGITIGSETFDGQTISIKADVVFDGAAVPLPPGLWLLASGLGILGLPRLSRRRSA
ncbi:MAG: VPLPA-CTERM sorting domain-containing protein [Steroidobacteraceae bacterium]|jgi:hypothetical protein